MQGWLSNGGRSEGASAGCSTEESEGARAGCSMRRSEGQGWLSMEGGLRVQVLVVQRREV